MIQKVLKLPGLLWASQRELRYARRRGAPGIEFANFGRALGCRLLPRQPRAALNLILTPVAILRYWEFPFAWSCLPACLTRCLDVSSPSLFSFFVSSRHGAAGITMINPDERDIRKSAARSKLLGFKGIDTRCAGIDEIAGVSEIYDCIWSISVVEHISGNYDDRYAMQVMWNALKPGGRLIITVPVNRRFTEVHLESDPYGLNRAQQQERYFFQRLYDHNALQERLLAPLRSAPVALRWFGERTSGHYAEYDRWWRAEGYACSVHDPREIVDHYQEYPSWDAMPGMGVCGFALQK